MSLDAPIAGQLGPPPPPEEPGGEGLSRRVAVLIMVVTLLGSVFAFLQTSAANRAALAARRSETAAVEAMGRLARGGGHIAVEQQISAQIGEEWWMGTSLLGSSAAGEIAVAMAAALDAQRLATIPYSDLVAYQREDGTVDWGAFVEDTLAPSYEAAEYQVAYAEERQEWGSKGGAYVAVVTVLAVALFLLGLSRTVAPGSGGPLVAAGAVLAAVATLWGFIVFLHGVGPPSAEAIDAYVEGKVAFSAVLWETDPELVRPQLDEALQAFTRAVETRPDYYNAYLGRGVTLFRLDLLAPGGPTGSEEAAADFAQVVRDNPLDAVAWGNLGAACFWLGDLEGAGEATHRALEIEPDDGTFNLNLGLFLSLVGDEGGYAAQLTRIEKVLTAENMPTWLRSYLFTSSTEVLNLADAYRPDMQPGVRRYREDLLRLEHQITVSRQFFATAAPAPVDASFSPFSFTLSDDGTQLLVTFDATGVVAGQRWLWRTYRGGVEDAVLSHEPEVWPFAVPDQPVTITLTLPDGFAAGVPVRVEVFLEGNLLQAGEFTP